MKSSRTRFGAYLLTDCIGQGGMAVVYRAKREGWSGFEKTVVVKAMLPALAAHREHVDRFIAEAKIQAQLSHPGIVQVHDFGVFDGTPYLVMEHLSGVNLSQLLNALAQAHRQHARRGRARHRHADVSRARLRARLPRLDGRAPPDHP